MLRIGFAVFYFYLYIKLFIWLNQITRNKLFKESIHSNTDMRKFIASFIYITMAICLSTLLLVFTVKQSSLASSQADMVSSSELFMKMDRALIPSDPRLWLIDLFTHTKLDFLLTYIYRKIDWVFAFILVALLLFQKTLFRKYILAFFLAPTLALPIWLAWPAVTPNEMYRNNMFHIPSIDKIQEVYKQVPLGYHLDKFMNYVEGHIENPKQEYPLVSTNPSMHVCWGFLITYFAILLWRPLGFIFIPWLLLTCVSTIYTFQHYLIDVPAGILCGLITIIFTNYLFNYERKYYTGNYSSLYFLDVLQEDIKRCIPYLKTSRDKRTIS